MPLATLEIDRFRCIERAALELDPRCNLIIGNNGSGKTSLLEASFLLGSGRSFRTHQTGPLVRQGAETFLVVGRTADELRPETIGVLGSRDAKEFRVAGQNVRSAAQLASRIPMQVVDPEVHRFIEDGPNRRRQFLDWGVFHVEPQFHSAWRDYTQALRQRNAALKMADTSLAIWDQKLCEHGERISAMRATYVAALRPFVDSLALELLEEPVVIEHHPGWRQGVSLTEAIETGRPRDLLVRTTTYGPHRADLRVKISAHDAKARVSRGQQKMLACVLLLAQQLHRASLGAQKATLLLDDPAAELDVDNLGKLVAAVAKIPVQLIVTGLSENLASFLPTARMFHVEHGRVRMVA